MLDQLPLPWRRTLAVRELLVQIPETGPWSATDHEREIVDFKQTPETTPTPAHALKTATERLRSEIVETAISFANARGGTIALGVRDRAKEGEPVVPGLDLGRWVPDDVRAFVHDRTVPRGQPPGADRRSSTSSSTSSTRRRRTPTAHEGGHVRSASVVTTAS